MVLSEITEENRDLKRCERFFGDSRGIIYLNATKICEENGCSQPIRKEIRVFQREMRFAQRISAKKRNYYFLGFS